MTSKIESMLDRLAEMRAAIDAINLRFDDLRDKVLTPEQKQELADIEAERATTIEAATSGTATIEAEISEEVKALQKTVKGAHLMAVYSKPAVTWDTKALTGYAAAHPEIEQFRKVGNPRVSIRNI
jgi:hypothetical protein